MSTPSILCAASLESALNHLLKLDADTPARLARLNGAVVGIELTGPNLCLFLLPGQHDVQVVDEYAGVPAVLVRGTPASFLLLARGAAPEAAGIEMVGDPLVAQSLQQLVRRLHPDWEEELSRLVGDVAAHQLGRAARGLRDWLRQARDTLLTDTAEYLHEESRALPDAGHTGALLDDVDTLRSDVDRLEARIRRLETRLGLSR